MDSHDTNARTDRYAIDEDIGGSGPLASERGFTDTRTPASHDCHHAGAPTGTSHETCDITAARDEPIGRSLCASTAATNPASGTSTPCPPNAAAATTPHAEPVDPTQSRRTAADTTINLEPDHQPDPYDDGQEWEPAQLSVGDPQIRKTRVLATECDTCIFQPGNPSTLEQQGSPPRARGPRGSCRTGRS